MPILKAKSKAYYDTFAGLIACTVLKIVGRTVTFKLTETVGTYKQGEILESYHFWVIPTAALIKKQYTLAIGPYNVQEG